MSVQLSELMTRARQLADMENSPLISDSELIYHINAAYQELYDIVVDTFEDYFIQAPVVFTLQSSDNGVYALPSDFYKLRGLDYLIGSDYVDLFRLDWVNRNRRNRSLRMTWIGFVSLKYIIMGTNLRIEPADSAPGQYQLWYIPTLTKLVNTTDTVNDMIARAGWEEYIVIDAARRMRIKEESSIADLNQAKDAMNKRIMEAAANRDADQPPHLSDTRAMVSDWDWNGW